MNDTHVSDCCGALLQVAGRTTRYYVCQECERPCDALPKVRLRPVDEAEDVWDS